MHWIDLAFLPEIEATLERFTINPKGEIDGFVFTDDTLVHIPPHLGRAVEKLIRPGEAARVRGLRPRGAAMVAAVWLANADGRSIIDDGPDDRKRDAASSEVKPQPGEAAGIVRLVLYAPKGELRGVLLADGTVVRDGPKEAQHFEKLLRPKATLAVRGNGLKTKYGRVIDAKEIGADFATLKPVKGAKAKEEKRSPKEKH